MQLLEVFNLGFDEELGEEMTVDYEVEIGGIVAGEFEQDQRRFRGLCVQIFEHVIPHVPDVLGVLYCDQVRVAERYAAGHELAASSEMESLYCALYTLAASWLTPAFVVTVCEE